ncbi:MAG TPA: orotidine-5'-phosphate decarboxylase [Candidatus Koribacter sp.]|jgi:orotidine-5'-phosphate decarboxylase
MTSDKLILALDVDNSRQAQQIVQSVGDSVSTFKVGKQLFTAEGPQIVRDLVAGGKKVFLDLKFHDIPNTVASAVRQATELRVSMLTVHASGGSKMLKAAADAAGDKALVLAVTVLTSLSDNDLSEIGIAGNVQAQVLRLGALARANGIRGLVASAHEARELRRELGDDFAIVTPGVRPAGAEKGDQARVVTPGDALRAGASHIVVGRPITEAKDPAAAARAILLELDGALQIH